ncbi:MAG: RDD family protein [Chloroflexi bacterium]|nr:RDD family protein [Chloroflexota bacterium]
MDRRARGSFYHFLDIGTQPKHNAAVTSSSPLSVVSCPHCGASGQETLFCKGCDRYIPDPSGSLEKVTFNRRFWGTYLLEGLIVIVTLLIGWLIWLYFTAKTSQTPAKRILNVYTLDATTSEPISAGRVWVRDFVVEHLLFGWLLSFFIGLAGLIDAAFVLFDKNRRSVHDHMMNTIVVYAPGGLPATGLTQEEVNRSPEAMNAISDQRRELARLKDRGILTDE